MSIQFESALIDVLKLLAIHSTWIVGIAYILSRFVLNTFLRRNIWRITMVCLGLLVLLAFSGLHHWNGADLLKTSVFTKSPKTKHSNELVTWQTMDLSHQTSFLVDSPELSVGTDEVKRIDTSSKRVTHSLITLLYFIGAMTVSSLMFLNAITWHQRIRSNAHKPNQSLLRLFKNSAHTLGFHQTPTILLNSQIKTPLVMGFIRPVMAFPSNFTESFSRKEQSLIMSHEIAHLREKDTYWLGISNIISVLLWWHPMVWVARWKLSESAEEAADAISVTKPEDRHRLAECLIRLGRQMTSMRWSGSFSIFGAGFKSQLGKRVDRLVNGKTEWNHIPNRFISSLIQALAMMAVLSLLMGLSSWMGISQRESATSAFRQSIIGITLMAQQSGTESLTDKEQSKINPQNQTVPPTQTIISVKPSIDEGSNEMSKENDTLNKLRSLILPAFTIQTNDLYSNFFRLRDAILSEYPNWTNLNFHISGPLVQSNDAESRPTSETSTAAVAYLNIGFNSSVTANSIQNNPPRKQQSSKENGLDVSGSSVHKIIHNILEVSHGKYEIKVKENSVAIRLDGKKSPILPQPSSSAGNIAITSSNRIPSSTHPENENNLYTRTYKTNPNTFIPRVRAIVGALKKKSTNQTESEKGETESNVQSIIHQFARNLGIADLEPTEDQGSKALFYNNRNGTLLVRLSMDDMQLLETAIHALQDRDETSTQIALDMQIVQLDVDGISILEDMGFEYPVDNNKNQFNQIVDADTFERIYLRMQMGSGVETLQTPRMTTLSGRQSKMSAQEERCIVTGNLNGVIQTERILTGPSLTILPIFLPNGKLELTTKFELLEFLGYDDPGPAMVVKNDQSVSQEELPKISSVGVTPEENETIKPGEYTVQVKPMPLQISESPLPRIKRLELETTAELKSGQTLIMGGLKTSHIVKHKSKIPMLGDIPLMGRLFRNESVDSSETHIYVFITPRIIDEYSAPQTPN